MKPEVGRIVFGEPIDHDAFAGRHGVITKIAGQRLHVKWPSTEKEAHLYKFVAVCDTQEEVEQIKKLSSHACSEIKSVKAIFERQWLQLTESAK